MILSGKQNKRTKLHKANESRCAVQCVVASERLPSCLISSQNGASKRFLEVKHFLKKIHSLYMSYELNCIFREIKVKEFNENLFIPMKWQEKRNCNIIFQHDKNAKL